MEEALKQLEDAIMNYIALLFGEDISKKIPRNDTFENRIKFLTKEIKSLN
jgi:predicted RNase H-like HicB family nuclease